MAHDVMVRHELDLLKAAAASASTWTSLDASGRVRYVHLAKRCSDEIWARYKAGNSTAENAARLAQQSRNEVMMVVRTR